MKRIIHLLSLLTVLFVLGTSPAAAQKGRVTFADQLYERYDFQNALRIYEKVYEKSGEDADPYVTQRIAQCHENMRQIEQAEPYYRELVTEFPDYPYYQFKLAQSLMKGGQYQEAFSFLRAYADMKGGYTTLPETYDADYLKEDGRITVERQDFNSKALDYSPLLVLDDLYFISTRGRSLRKDDMDYVRGGFSDIYILEEDSAQGKPKVFRNNSVSGSYHEGQIAFDPLFNDMYVTRNTYRGNRDRVEEGEDDNVHLKIFKLAYVEDEEGFGDELSDPVDFNSNDYSTAFPAITRDAEYMFFASNKSGGFGGMDIYIAKRVDGRWTNAINLGPEVNTPGDDTYPYVAPDGSLYFASEGHLGLGGLDIYRMPLNDDGSYGYPENMRAPINSPADDYGITFYDDMLSGYFTTNRGDNGGSSDGDGEDATDGGSESSFSDDDIYSFVIEGITLDLCVYAEETGEAIDSADIVLTNLDDGTVMTKRSRPDCTQEFNVLPYTNYKLEVSKEGYLPETAEFRTADDNVSAEIPLVRDYGIVLDVLVTDMQTGAILPDADVTLRNLTTGDDLMKPTNSGGKTFFVLEEGMQYELVTDKRTDDCCELYLVDSRSFNTVNIQTPASLFQEVALDKLVCGDIRVIPIYYDLDKSFIRPDAARVLDQLVVLLQDNPSIEVELASHTDCRASQQYNRKLSSARAESAVEYLIKNGVSFRRLTAAGYGETQLVNDCECENGRGRGRTSACTEEMHQANRRTEFKVVKLKDDCL